MNPLHLYHVQMPKKVELRQQKVKSAIYIIVVSQLDKLSAFVEAKRCWYACLILALRPHAFR